MVGCSLLEESLEQLLRSRMSKAADPKHVNHLFSGYAPLATFSAKSSLCYAFGFIDERTFRDLEIIRKIRNRFAHEHANKEFFDSATFNQLCAIQCTYPIGTPDYAGASVSDLKREILDFHPADDQEPASIEMSGARAKFLLSVQVLCSRIRAQQEKT
jgi:DNA-binding MltR family transcriptional regulator